MVDKNFTGVQWRPITPPLPRSTLQTPRPPLVLQVHLDVRPRPSRNAIGEAHNLFVIEAVLDAVHEGGDHFSSLFVTRRTNEDAAVETAKQGDVDIIWHSARAHRKREERVLSWSMVQTWLACLAVVGGAIGVRILGKLGAAVELRTSFRVCESLAAALRPRVNLDEGCKLRPVNREIPIRKINLHRSTIVRERESLPHTLQFAAMEHAANKRKMGRHQA